MNTDYCAAAVFCPMWFSSDLIFDICVHKSLSKANTLNHSVKSPESHHRPTSKSEWLCELSECLYVWTLKLQTELWIWLWIVSEILILSLITASGDLPEEKREEREERRCWEVSTVGKKVGNGGWGGVSVRRGAFVWMWNSISSQISTVSGETTWTSVMLLSSLG